MNITEQNNKRIAKNTLVLYFRTLLVMLIALYTSRVILNTLGVEDFGIYNVVSGTVAMLSVISGSLSQAISRFITFELGAGNNQRLQRIFSTSVLVELGLSLIIIILGEIIGLWFLNNHVNMPVDRLNAAYWVLHCSLLAFVINLVSIPFNATIIAHEHMAAFAYISILDAILKLGIVFFLQIITIDKLIFYAILVVIEAFVIRITYTIYCHHYFSETRGNLKFNNKLFREICSFAGWKFLSDSAYVFSTQGVNMLINVYFGVALNAARGLATQAQSAVMQFVNNFTVSINPQITKYYASGQMDTMYKLVCSGTKFSFYLMLFFSIPFICEAEYILKLWLKNVPPYTTYFLQLSLIGSLAVLLGNCLITAIQATGNIRNYAIWVTIVANLVLPVSWICFEMGCSVISTYIVFIIIYAALNFVRLYIARQQLKFPMKDFIKEVYLRVLIVMILSFIIPLTITYYMDSSFVRLCITCFVSMLSTLFFILTCGMNANERTSTFNIINKRIISKLIKSKNNG